MPQLIAMVLVVVGALVYMFQSFGGTGNNIEGMAQKTSIITELNNIKSGLSVALRSKDINTTTTLKELGTKEYFTSQINDQLVANSTDETYKAISFGADESMTLKLIVRTKDQLTNTSNGDKHNDNIGEITSTQTEISWVPGILVNISGELEENKGFLESQIAKDLNPIAWVDREGNATTADATDGSFIVYYKDLPKNKIK